MNAHSIAIILNGRPAETNAESTVQDLMNQLGLGGPGLAVAVNDEVVRKETFAQVRLSPGDKVEVIQAVGGG